jgi:hypothetical protein
MKRYIKASTNKPVLEDIDTSWEELEDGSGIMLTISDPEGETLFEELFNYEDVDSDAIYDSAVDMATIVLNQTYELSDEAISKLYKLGDVES